MDSIERFIEQMANHAEADGLPRISGRIMAYFVINGGPFSFSEIADNLGISRGSASTNTRLLRDLGILERYQEPGSRQDYYVLAVQPYQRLLKGYIERMESSINNIKQLVDAPETELPTAALERLDALEGFYHTAIESTRVALEKTGGNHA
jgi:DNA-binding transcriptional regulator GbsR (MarR family)